MAEETVVVTSESAPGFRNGLFSCFSDCPVCIMNCFCPCVTSSKIRAFMDEREWHFLDCCCAMAYQNHVYTNKQTIRKRQGYADSKCADCLLACFCGPCSAGQNHLEARDMGYEPEVMAARREKNEAAEAAKPKE